MFNEDGSNRSHVEVNYVGSQGIIQNRGYQAPPPQGNRFELMMQQILDGQNRCEQEVNENMADLNKKMNSVYNELNRKLDNLTCHVDSLDKQVSHIYYTSEAHVPCNEMKIKSEIKNAPFFVDIPGRSIYTTDRLIHMICL